MEQNVTLELSPKELKAVVVAMEIMNKVKVPCCLNCKLTELAVMHKIMHAVEQVEKNQTPSSSLN